MFEFTETAFKLQSILNQKADSRIPEIQHEKKLIISYQDFSHSITEKKSPTIAKDHRMRCPTAVAGKEE